MDGKFTQCSLCRTGSYPYFGYVGSGVCDHCGTEWTYDEGDMPTEESLQRLWSKMPRWIPVSERLPEDDSVVLAFMPEGSELKPEVREMYFSDGEWMNDRGHWPEVTHWMPMPEPPAA